MRGVAAALVASRIRRLTSVIALAAVGALSPSLPLVGPCGDVSLFFSPLFRFLLFLPVVGVANAVGWHTLVTPVLSPAIGTAMGAVGGAAVAVATLVLVRWSVVCVAVRLVWTGGAQWWGEREKSLGWVGLDAVHPVAAIWCATPPVARGSSGAPAFPALPLTCPVLSFPFRCLLLALVRGWRCPPRMWTGGRNCVCQTVGRPLAAGGYFPRLGRAGWVAPSCNARIVQSWLRVRLSTPASRKLSWPSSLLPPHFCSSSVAVPVWMSVFGGLPFSLI